MDKNDATRAAREVDLTQLAKTETVDSAEYVPFAEATHAIVKESQVDILFMIPPQIDDLGILHSIDDRLKKRLIRVKVWSKKRPELCSFTDIACAGKSQAEMSHAIEWAAPALGERQEILYGDKHELSRLSRDAVKHFGELIAVLTKQGEI